MALDIEAARGAPPVASCLSVRHGRRPSCQGLGSIRPGEARQTSRRNSSANLAGQSMRSRRTPFSGTGLTQQLRPAPPRAVRIYGPSRALPWGSRSSSSTRLSRRKCAGQVGHGGRRTHPSGCQTAMTVMPDVPPWPLRIMRRNGSNIAPAAEGFYANAKEEYTAVNGGEIMYGQGGSRAEMWRLKSVPPVAFNQERPNLTEGGLDVQGGYLPPCSQGLFRRRDERPRGGPSVRATPGHGAQDARVLRAPRVSTATTGSQTEARSI